MSEKNVKLQVMIVDDSVVCRHTLHEMLEDPDAGAEVVAFAPNGKIALDKLKQCRVDLVLLDIEMPIMNGIETLSYIKEDYPEIGVIMVSGVHVGNAELAVKALELGAVEVLAKPGPNSWGDQKDIDSFKMHLKAVLKLASTRNFARIAKQLSASKKNALISNAVAGYDRVKRSISRRIFKDNKKLPAMFDAVGIAVSTGGPNALMGIMPAFPEKLGVPLFIVQHMPEKFTKALAGSLNQKASIAIKEGEAGEVVKKDTVYIAPGNTHMVVKRDSELSNTVRIDLNQDPPVNNCRPAADVLFKSLSDVYGKRLLVVIMTGMGIDGHKGVEYIKNGRGGYCMTQSEDTCIVYGMPRAVDLAGLSDEQVKLEDIPARIVELTN